MALHRCRQIAGVRIQHKCKDCGSGHDQSVVASVVGPTVAADPVALVRDGANGFRSLLVEWGVGVEQATSLQQQLEVYAARTLFETKCPDLPSGFVSAIEKAKEVSGALELAT